MAKKRIENANDENLKIRTERQEKLRKRKRFKNFLYLSSDIFVAIVIVAIALLVVLWRTNVLLNYTV